MFSTFTCASELLIAGMTIGDWVALISLIASLLFGLYRIGKIMSRLSDSIDSLNKITKRINDDNNRRDRKLEDHERHLQRHDEQLIKDETVLSQVVEQIKQKRSSNND